LELVELQKRLGEVEVARVTEASELAVLEGEMSKVLVFLGRPPHRRDPPGPGQGEGYPGGSRRYPGAPEGGACLQC
jgi:hypothetical protein